MDAVRLQHVEARRTRVRAGERASEQFPQTKKGPRATVDLRSSHMLTRPPNGRHINQAHLLPYLKKPSNPVLPPHSALFTITVFVLFSHTHVFLFRPLQARLIQ
jgi:hypothetical protein